MQQLSIAVALSEINSNKMPGDSDMKTLKFKWGDIMITYTFRVSKCCLSCEQGLHLAIPALEVYYWSTNNCSAVSHTIPFPPSPHRYAQGPVPCFSG